MGPEQGRAILMLRAEMKSPQVSDDDEDDDHDDDSAKFSESEDEYGGEKIGRKGATKRNSARTETNSKEKEKEKGKGVTIGNGKRQRGNSEELRDSDDYSDSD